MSFSINEAIKEKTWRFHHPAEEGYWKLSPAGNGVGPWLEYYHRDFQEMMDLPTPQTVLIYNTQLNRDIPVMETYTEELDSNDKIHPIEEKKELANGRPKYR